MAGREDWLLSSIPWHTVYASSHNWTTLEWIQSCFCRTLAFNFDAGIVSIPVISLAFDSTINTTSHVALSHRLTNFCIDFHPSDSIPCRVQKHTIWCIPFIYCLVIQTQCPVQALLMMDIIIRGIYCLHWFAKAWPMPPTTATMLTFLMVNAHIDLLIPFGILDWPRKFTKLSLLISCLTP